MILIADAGATKTDWCLLNSTGDIVTEFIGDGINANYLANDDIFRILSQTFSRSLPQELQGKIEKVYYFGSGCSTPEKQKLIQEILLKHLPQASVNAEHDLTAAAIALCQNEQGIACILGTGSNACIYDGKKITKTRLSLGYLLGDEGSGVDIGKQVLTAYLKGKLPEDLLNDFYKQYQKTPLEFIKEMYETKNYSAFFSQFTYFARVHLGRRAIGNIVFRAFSNFLQEQVLVYPNARKYKIHFVGSIALNFDQLLIKSCSSFALRPGKIIQKPMQGLIDFYRSQT